MPYQVWFYEPSTEKFNTLEEAIRFAIKETKRCNKDHQVVETIKIVKVKPTYEVLEP